MTDLEIVLKCLLKARSYRGLQHATGVSRQVFWRLQTGATSKLEGATRTRLLDYLHG